MISAKGIRTNQGAFPAKLSWTRYTLYIVWLIRFEKTAPFFSPTIFVVYLPWI